MRSAPRTPRSWRVAPSGPPPLVNLPVSWNPIGISHIGAVDPAFGYRFIADELAAQGVAAGANRVARL